MAASTNEVMAWAHTVMSRKGGPAHTLLDLPEDCGGDEAQQAFHKVARNSHPDLHRHNLSPEDFELLNSAYAAVAGAYQELRSRPPRPKPTAPSTRPSGRMTPPPQEAAQPPPSSGGFVPSATAAQHMSPKALLYYRKAELCLKKGDLRGAILQLKLAGATDPRSTFLRNALAEVETEVLSSR